ncbi:MAG TPA: haloalkane dehalogenase [Bradyrhizobium sp.]|uniref:haloalkane dehalogenase n=1 Tax=Bradyrhizobium sp. TaxID=376 RepID=UPI002C2A20B0|nr:haloalkane dehalogenase [Bradyrhizobium sp.]HLZ06404.1 haloalkane dehalogenase [Bradyrhizobium sp.]
MTKQAEIFVRRQLVLGSTMAYRETGDTDAPVALFLHGNPASSYIWRNILPHVAPVAHCIAPDLIGFGQSGKPDIAYRFFDHVDYLDAFIHSLGISSAYLVAQDWGAALAYHLAARRPDFVRGLAFMEFVRPASSYEDFHQLPAAREAFRKFRTPGEGEAMILEGNAFIERVLPGAVAHPLTDEDMAVYRAPFADPKSRRPMLALPRDLPIAGEPADMHQALSSSLDALKASTYPKLLFVGEPGTLITPAYAAEFTANMRHISVVPLGSGRHNLQEDHPDAIGRSVAGWIAGIKAVTARHQQHAA